MVKRHCRMVAGLLLASLLCACGAGQSLSSAPNQTNSLLPSTSGQHKTSAVADASTRSLAIDAGSTVGSGSWQADTDYSAQGYSGVAAVSSAINTSHATNPAPQAVYQTQRYAVHLTYTIPNLTPDAAYTVRLHFVESFWTAAGQRVFNVSIDGNQVLTNFDIFKAAGGENIAVVQQFSSNADASGKITIKFDAVANDASVAGIEVLGAGAAPTAPPNPAGYADGNVPPAGWQFPYNPSPFTVAVCASDPCAPALDPNSATEVGRVVGAGSLDLGDIYEGYPTDNDFPIYYASAGDPSYTVTCDLGGCGKGTITANIPNGAYASNGSDHHLAVINISSGTETDFWEFNDNGSGTGTTKPVYGGGYLHAGSGGVCQATSFANRTNSCANSSTGAGLPIQSQVLDPREILAGNISHTLYVAIGCGQSTFTFPADHSDGQCSAGPKYGQRIWLDLSDAKINALGDPAWAKTLLHAMHHYGWTVSDNNGGTSAVAFANIAPQSFTIWGQANPWTAFFNIAGGGKFATIPTTGISQANVHILAPCVNTKSC